MYERLKGREDINPLQYRLVLLVHIRKQRVRLREMEIVALAGINEHNKDSVIGLLDAYREFLFPGTKEATKENTEEEKAKKALADETKKLYLVKPYDKVTDETWQEMADKGGDAAFIAHRQLRESRQFKSRMTSKGKQNRRGRRAKSKLGNKKSED